MPRLFLPQLLFVSVYAQHTQVCTIVYFLILHTILDDSCQFYLLARLSYQALGDMIRPVAHIDCVSRHWVSSICGRGKGNGTCFATAGVDSLICVIIQKRWSSRETPEWKPHVDG
ncbi:hypothetical protein L210DRAFT_2017666 [Boletus edulis BED1]|uniref:Secreted protein n=1 Tax=Boletus edulis BED1 TaxID=1328754 RepID=A0AAD4GLA2_BOLED|nr:hypothetical protein L210DRAFT_2017666 [Boletus edulis BED1]